MIIFLFALPVQLPFLLFGKASSFRVFFFPPSFSLNSKAFQICKIFLIFFLLLCSLFLFASFPWISFLFQPLMLLYELILIYNSKQIIIFQTPKSLLILLEFLISEITLNFFFSTRLLHDVFLSFLACVLARCTMLVLFFSTLYITCNH